MTYFNMLILFILKLLQVFFDHICSSSIGNYHWAYALLYQYNITSYILLVQRF
jgi:hypothetical protein